MFELDEEQHEQAHGSHEQEEAEQDEQAHAQEEIELDAEKKLTLELYIIKNLVLIL